MAYHIQHLIIDNRERPVWKVSGFARSYATAEDAWKAAASYDPDALIPPDVRVVDSTGKAVERPSAGKYQAELLGL